MANLFKKSDTDEHRYDDARTGYQDKNTTNPVAPSAEIVHLDHPNPPKTNFARDVLVDRERNPDAPGTHDDYIGQGLEKYMVPGADPATSRTITTTSTTTTIATISPSDPNAIVVPVESHHHHHFAGETEKVIEVVTGTDGRPAAYPVNLHHHTGDSFSTVTSSPIAPVISPADPEATQIPVIDHAAQDRNVHFTGSSSSTTTYPTSGVTTVTKEVIVTDRSDPNYSSSHHHHHHHSGETTTVSKEIIRDSSDPLIYESSSSSSHHHHHSHHPDTVVVKEHIHPTKIEERVIKHHEPTDKHVVVEREVIPEHKVELHKHVHPVERVDIHEHHKHKETEVVKEHIHQTHVKEIHEHQRPEMRVEVNKEIVHPERVQETNVVIDEGEVSRKVVDKGVREEHHRHHTKPVEH